MNEKAGLHDLDDDEIVDAKPEVIEPLNCDEKLVTRKAKKVVKTEKYGTGPVAHHPAADHIHAVSTCSCACNNSQDFLANISQVLDPSLWHTRADDVCQCPADWSDLYTI